MKTDDPSGPEPAVEGYNPIPGEAADGPDPIIGQHHGQGVDTLHRAGQPDGSIALGKQFVVTTGGEYFLAPSISGLQALAALGQQPPHAG